MRKGFYKIVDFTQKKKRAIKLAKITTHHQKKQVFEIIQKAGTQIHIRKQLTSFIEFVEYLSVKNSFKILRSHGEVIYRLEKEEVKFEEKIKEV